MATSLLGCPLVSSHVIFSDLDGSLLDEQSYSYEVARPALEAVRDRNIPLVFCTSKTKSEVENVRAELDNRDPFIVENGAAVFIPKNYFPFPIPTGKRYGRYDVLQFGVPYLTAATALHHASQQSGCPVRSFCDMPVSEVAERCHMSITAASRAKQREYDEPFEILTDSPDLMAALFQRIVEQGLTWTFGGRFYHIRGRHNKGEAAESLIRLYRSSNPEVVTIGVGDGPNDVSLLEVVDLPALIPNRPPSQLQRRDGPELYLASRPGPGGWNEAILHLLGPNDKE